MQLAEEGPEVLGGSGGGVGVGEEGEGEGEGEGEEGGEEAVGVVGEGGGRRE